MDWIVELDKKAVKEFKSLAKEIQKRVIKLMDKLASMENPRDLGKPLKGKFIEFWRYRIGDYRIICTLDDGTKIILMVAIRHRREVYKK